MPSQEERFRQSNIAKVYSAHVVVVWLTMQNQRKFHSFRVIALLLALLGLSNVAAADAIERGQKYVMATHSFNVFIGPRTNRLTGGTSPGPLAALAEEAGKQGHANLAVQMIGGSTPMQHWNQGNGDDSQNIAKVALHKGGVDVFTMSPNAMIPEEGIDLFGDLLIQTNPQARLMVQASWSAWDGNGSTRSVGKNCGNGFVNADRDSATLGTIDDWLATLHGEGQYFDRLRSQLVEINHRANRVMASVVPSNVAVYTLRKQIIKGNVAGITKQSEVFRDPIGHGRQPVMNVVTYAWFAAMYRQSPLGLQALINPSDPTSAEREILLQKIAWNAVVAEPMSGVSGSLVPLN